MFDFCLCTNSNCLQHSVCNRFLNKGSTNPVEIRFRNLCYSENNYQWFYGDRDKMIKVDLINDEIIVETVEKGCE